LFRYIAGISKMGDFPFLGVKHSEGAAIVDGWTGQAPCSTASCSHLPIYWDRGWFLRSK
jgi:hypothetical protein